MRYLIQLFRRAAMIVATLALILIGCLVLAGCDGDTILPSANPASPTPAGAVTVTNTTTTTITIDRSDTEATPTPTSPPASSPGALPLPAYGEGLARDYAAQHPALVTHSCQLTDGDGAWQFLDGLIALLQAQARDARWGYLCKDANCTSLGRDVITYKASSGDTGIWIVDVLGNHCPGPSDSPTQFRWGPLPFETVRRWIGHR